MEEREFFLMNDHRNLFKYVVTLTQNICSIFSFKPKSKNKNQNTWWL